MNDRLAAAPTTCPSCRAPMQAHPVAAHHGATLELDQRVLRGEEVLITASVRVACVANGRPARIPKGVREALGG